MNSLSKKYTAFAILGNTLEMYEYALYGYFGPIIATLFFPTKNPNIRLIETFSIFAIGYLIRPIGALFFSYFCDRYGRKRTLAVTISMMALATGAIGLLPTYAQIGTASCVLLVFCRLLQGLAVGSEFCSAMVYLLEHHPKQHGFYGGWIWLTGSAGFLFGSLMGAFITHIGNEEFLFSWGWRIPFFSGLLLGIFGLYLNSRMPETPDFLTIKAKKHILANPVLTALRHQRQLMFIFMALILLPATAFFIFFVYLSTYLHTQLHMPLALAFTLNSIAMMIYMPCMPLFGALADKIGYRPVLLIGSLGFCLFSYPAFLLLQQATVSSILCAQVIAGILIACCYAPIPAVMVESTPINMRYSSIALPFNVIVALSGTVTPIVVTFLVKYTENFTAPSWYLAGLSIIMLLTVSLSKITSPQAVSRSTS